MLIRSSDGSTIVNSENLEAIRIDQNENTCYIVGEGKKGKFDLTFFRTKADALKGLDLLFNRMVSNSYPFIDMSDIKNEIERKGKGDFDFDEKDLDDFTYGDR